MFRWRGYTAGDHQYRYPSQNISSHPSNCRASSKAKQWAYLQQYQYCVANQVELMVQFRKIAHCVWVCRTVSYLYLPFLHALFSSTASIFIRALETPKRKIQRSTSYWWQMISFKWKQTKWIGLLMLLPPLNYIMEILLQLTLTTIEVHCVCDKITQGKATKCAQQNNLELHY